MKKSNMLIAVFAVLAAASVAKAGEIKIDFDGKSVFAVPSMHEIFAENHQLVPAGTITAEAATEKRLMGGGDDPCCDNPNILCYAPCEPGPELVKAAVPANFEKLARYYQEQENIKAVVAAYYSSKGDNAAAAALAAKDVRIAAGNGVVYVVRPGVQEKIADRGLSAKVEALVRPASQQKIVEEGVLLIVGCMYDKECWDAVGDGVSAISEWANS